MSEDTELSSFKQMLRGIRSLKEQGVRLHVNAVGSLRVDRRDYKKYLERTSRKETLDVQEAILAPQKKGR